MEITFISGGQTGTDRGMLDACLDLDFPCGGWCPQGRLAEDGPIDSKYPLEVLPGAGYPERTRENVLDSDGTIILFREELTGGTKSTQKLVRSRRKPYLLLDLEQIELEEAAETSSEMIFEKGLWRINISGPRGSEWPESHQLAYQFTSKLIAKVRGED
ncbi:MAG: putative molybdenum carrier protein [Planctomycetaceae bacterium]|jgi:hypothetical protein|nr:putative molybdenum carrier protein [Planctomycetaceae bacterium]MDG2390119.1 putative molybdenum carrier protein [Planctomycetaceae bacterium]